MSRMHKKEVDESDIQIFQEVKRSKGVFDKYGNPVSAGVYIFQIYTGDPSLGSGHGIVQTRKMIILK